MKPTTILVVDDEEIVRKTLHIDLTAQGYAVTVAGSGADALAVLRAQPHDLVLTDLIMEGIGGLEVLQAAKALDPDLQVMVLTGYGALETAIEALRLGAADYLLKPYNRGELLLRMAACVEKQTLQRKLKMYESILPMCTQCKQIRDDRGTEPGTGEWVPVADYILKRTTAQVSHTFCPACAQEWYPDLNLKPGA